MTRATHSRTGYSVSEQDPTAAAVLTSALATLREAARYTGGGIGTAGRRLGVAGKRLGVDLMGADSAVRRYPMRSATTAGLAAAAAAVTVVVLRSRRTPDRTA